MAARRAHLTLLFTDVERATETLCAFGDRRYAAALAEHRRALDSAFRRHGGALVDAEGDGLFYVFPRGCGAVEAAVAGQAELRGGLLRVRMGLHSGKPLLTELGYVGLDVHRAARIAAAGHGGQVLVSETTRRLAPDADLHDLGEHRLKGIPQLERIYQLGCRRFPPLRTVA
jgi:class 3 adenylate cyclase